MNRKVLAGLVFGLGIVLGPVAGFFAARVLADVWAGIVACGAVWVGSLTLSHRLSPPKHRVPKNLPEYRRDKDWNAPDDPDKP